MKIEQIYTGCLAQGAYFIQCGHEAVIIDPLRDVEPYIRKAAQNNVRIRYVLETHFHADFVSGHLNLSKKTGAAIVYGPTAQPAFDAYIAKDNELLKVGDCSIEVIHTPGHTMESTCYLLIDENNKPVALFSGDTLFIGDVGRPDLAQKLKPELTKEMLAGLLFDSLRNKIMTLPDDVMVYPAHGAGSACGKNMSRQTMDTLGHQKQTNYALRTGISKEEFIKELLSGLVEPPAYFPSNVLLNIQGYENMDEVLKRGKKALTPKEFESLANQTGALILDTRHAKEFAKAFIPNSINIGIDGNFATWAGTLIPDIRQEILLVNDPGREEEVITRLARVGYDHTIGYLNGGIEAWEHEGREMDHIETITVDDLADKLKRAENINILDVRKQTEFESEHIQGALNFPLDIINDNLTRLDKNKTYYVHCAGGYRSMIFNSILKSRGYHNLIDVQGGFDSVKRTNSFPLTEYVRPTSML